MKSKEITWTATATGGNGTKTYRFKLYKDGVELIGGTYNSYIRPPKQAHIRSVSMKKTVPPL